MVWKGDSQNRLAKSLVTLIDQVVQQFPNRNTRNDGTIGDVRHQQEGVKSDHNPNIRLGGKGIVTALDITHDPAHGFDALAFAESLRQQKEPRIKYVIFNGRIFSSEVHPWEWRARNKGPGDHAEHVHVSVLDDPKLFDDTTPWNLDISGAATGKTAAFPPNLQRGDSGPAVHDLQGLLGIEADGVFDADTENAVRSFQARNNLVVDGVVGSHTWGVLLASSPFKAARTADAVLAQETVNDIVRAAAGSSLATVKWNERGVAPIGYIKGMAVTYGLAYAKLKARDSAAVLMAAKNSGQDETDALSWYDSRFRAAGMDNSVSGESTLRHLFVLLIGLGMRESSGRYFEGRDMSAHNVDADTAEAGLFQMSWNARNASSELPRLFAKYSARPEGFLPIFQEGLPLKETENFGSGEGAAFQRLCKTCPAFAAEAAAVGLRVLRHHWGPINRHDAEIRPEAELLLKKVEEIVDRQRLPVPTPQPFPTPLPFPTPQPFPAPRPFDPIQLLLVLLTLGDSSKRGQADPLMMILPIILSSVLTGKQPNVTDLLTTMLTGGRPAAAPGQAAPAPLSTDPLAILLPLLLQGIGGVAPAPAPAAQAQPQPATDLAALLVPLLFERITGKPLAGTEPKADAPSNPNTPVLSRPSVQLSSGALGIVTILQSLGQIGLPFNLGAAVPSAGLPSTTAGTLSTLIPLVVGAVGATGGWGALAGVAGNLLSGFVSKFAKN